MGLDWKLIDCFGLCDVVVGHVVIFGSIVPESGAERLLFCLIVDLVRLNLAVAQEVATICFISWL